LPNSYRAVGINEALSVYEEEFDIIGMGSVELLRGRVETVARENARDAASAHDVLQIAAWKIVKNRFHESEAPFGAAAAGYEMLIRGHRSVGNQYEAEQAGMEAIRLHAASGREEQARALLQSLQNQGLGWQDVDAMDQSIASFSRDYDNALHEIRRARDYEQVYRRLVHAGDPVQAWQFRQKANNSLAQASKRAMHRRQTGIVALLYNSNDNRRAARDSLARARALFAAESRDDLIEHINAAEQKIW